MVLIEESLKNVSICPILLYDRYPQREAIVNFLGLHEVSVDGPWQCGAVVRSFPGRWP